ncbi:MAG TPA: carboxypeptidase-like regulatory domain-containing protein, partial [Rhodothermales bacterium]|nr:carboxypeptidase-like regulatory domain-containing protein [Rhodothermales bacterium]
MHKRLLRSLLLSCWCLAGWSLGLLLLGAGTAWAQQTQYTVTGRVIDAVTEQPLPGANVRFDNTTIGTAADLDGAFTLTANREGGTYELVFSFIGYRPERRTVTLGSQRTVDVGTVALEEDIVRGEEIVVTGTSAPTARKQLGNAVSTVTARELEDTASPALDRALQGKIAGAYVQQNSGNP